MTIPTRPLVLSLLIALLAYPPSLVSAAPLASFDPNFLLTDEEMQSWSSMTLSDIQHFLDGQGGYLARYRTIDVDGQEKSAAEIIYRAAMTHRINPKYLLVKLQKEQSLINAASPTQKQLDWATGYGICDSCSMEDPTLQRHRGFATQVDSAAGIMRWYYDNLGVESWIKRQAVSYAIDNVTVRPATQATALLYTYTPHIEGNKNFWTLWQRWFDQVYPDGSLLKSATAPTIYVIRDGKKRPFATMAALSTRFDVKRVIVVPDGELARYETGTPLTLPNYSLLKVRDTTYLLVDDTLYPFASSDVVRQLGYYPDEVIDGTEDDLTSYAMGSVITAEIRHPFGRLVRVKENKQMYFIKDGVLHHVSDERIARAYAASEKPEVIAATDLESTTLGSPLLFQDGTLIAVKGLPEVYVIEHGKKRHIPSIDVFRNLGYRDDQIVWTDQVTSFNHPTGEPLTYRPLGASGSSEQKTESPLTTPPKSVMIRTPENQTSYVGDAFQTPVNTYLVADAEGMVLLGKNIDDVRPLASFTKVMTGYRLLKEGLPLSRATTYVPSRHKSIYGSFRVASGEAILNSDLLLSMLISSINTPANMLVDKIETNRSAFVKRMNTQAKDWGLTKTSFMDVSGEEVANESTAREFLTIYRNATENIELTRVLGLPGYTYYETKDTDQKPKHFDTHSNELMAKTNLPFKIITSKTGYLDEAGAGLVMLIERPSDKKRWYIITMGNPDNTARRFDEPERLARFVVSQF